MRPRGTDDDGGKPDRLDCMALLHGHDPDGGGKRGGGSGQQPTPAGVSHSVASRERNGLTPARADPSKNAPAPMRIPAGIQRGIAVASPARAAAMRMPRAAGPP